MRFRFLALGTLAVAACNAGHLDDGTPPDQGMSPGAVTLQLTLPSEQSFCDTISECGGGASHVSFRTLAGETLEVGTRYCGTDCSTCRLGPCPAIPICTPVAGAQLITEVDASWDGSFVKSGTCGNGVACTSPRFVLPGRYVARMCATPGTLTMAGTSGAPCTPTGDAECVDVPFDLPGPSPITAALPPLLPPPPPTSF